MIVLRELLNTFAYLLLSRRRLERHARDLLMQRFFPNCGFVVLFKSGRSALSAIFEALAAQYPGAQILVPDYICNVVPRAVTRAGFEAITYRTTEGFEVDLDDLLDKIARPSIAGVILASIFGAQNTSGVIVDRIRRVREDILLVLDDCQNLLLDRPITADARTVVVFSFNMKTIAGAMGGGLCGRVNVLDIQIPRSTWFNSCRLECAIALVFWRQLGVRIWQSICKGFNRQIFHAPGPEYSRAVGRIHYDMVPQRIAKFSLVRAIIGMHAAPETESRRRANFASFCDFVKQTGLGEIIPTRSPATAPFVPVRLARPASLPMSVPWKGSYAVDGAPSKTLRPELVSFRNDGLAHFRTFLHRKYGRLVRKCAIKTSNS